MTNDVTFKLPNPGYEQYSWLLMDEHGPSSVTPLLESQGFGPRSSSGSGVPRMLRINGFSYARVEGVSNPDATGPFGANLPSRLVEVTGWREVWIAEANKVGEWLEAFDPASVPPAGWRQEFASQMRYYQEVFFGVHGNAVGPVRAAADAFSDLFLRRFGEERRADLNALFQGMPNCSLDRAIALWGLGRALREEPELQAALDRGVAFNDAPASGDFRALFNEMLSVYGCTTNADLLDLPVWRDDPSIPLAAVRAYARQSDDADPRLSAARQRQHREEIEAELRGLAAYDDELAAIVRLLPLAQQLMPCLEDHNLLCDQRMEAGSRARWLSIGRFLQQKDLMASADDVFYLYFAELVEALEDESKPDKTQVAARRRHLQRARAMMPPPVLGKPLVQTPKAVASLIQGSETRVLRGNAAAPGSYRGRARVIETLEEAARLEEGDILVCRTTSPPWTPFFNLISALVTNTGGSLSHGAVVAREFGIPAVVGTTIGTATIPDGATITVDGTNGQVIIES